MSYDPTKPVEGTLCDAAEMRSQLQGLQTLITAGTVTGATVDSVTLGSGTSVSVALIAGILHFDFLFQPGPPGEVTQAQLTNDLSNAVNQAMLITLPQTSANSNNVALLTVTSGDFAIQTLIDKLNELITTLRRQGAEGGGRWPLAVGRRSRTESKTASGGSLPAHGTNRRGAQFGGGRGGRCGVV